MRSLAHELTVAAWTAGGGGRAGRSRTRWHVLRGRARGRRALCGVTPRRGAILYECRTQREALRVTGPICLRCAGWLAARGATPERTS